MIAKVFESALAQLVELPGDEYKALLKKLAEEALANEPEEEAAYELVFNMRDRKAYGRSMCSAVKRKVKLATDTAPILGGLIVRKGRIEYNCSLDLIMDSVSEQLSAEVSGALLAEEGGCIAGQGLVKRSRRPGPPG